MPIIMESATDRGATLTTDQLSGRWGRVLGPSALLVMLAAFFWQPLVLGRAFYVYDLSLAYLPVQLENARLRAQGEFPLWNQYLFCGYPINAESESGGLYPPALILNLPLSPERTFGLYVIFHYALAFGSMWMLGRALGIGRVGRSAAALILVFGGTFVGQTVNLPLVTTFAWAPLILALQLCGLQQRRYGPAVWSGLVFGLSLLGAHPQMSFYTGLMVFLMALCRPAASERRAGFLFSMCSAALILVVALGIGAPQLLYNLELLSYSDRSGGVTYEFLTMLSYPPHYLAQLMLPDLLGRETHYLGTEVFEEQRAYLGIVTLGLLMVGWRRAGQGRTFLRIVLLSSLFLAFGHFVGVYHLFKHVPGFNLFRCPARWMFPFSMSAALLAGYGLDRMLATGLGPKADSRKGTWAFGLVAVLCTIVWFVTRATVPSDVVVNKSDRPTMLKAYAAFTDFGLQNRREHVRSLAPEVFAERAAGAWGDVHRCAGIAALMALGAAVWWAFSHGRRIGPLAVLALALLGLDLWLANGGIHRYQDATFYRTTPARIREYQKDPEVFRIMPVAARTDREPIPGSLIRNFGSLYELEVLDGFASADLLLLNRFKQAGIPQQRFLNMVNAKYVQSPVSLNVPGLERISGEGETYVYRNPTALPRAFLSRDVRVIEEVDALFAFLRDPAFDPARTVLLDHAPTYPASPSASPPPEDVVELVRHAGQSVQIHAELAAPAILILLDFDYPGWVASVNGERRPILRANGIFRALALGAGSHDVVFEYKPLSFYVGLYVLCGTLLLAAIVRAFAVARSGADKCRAPAPGLVESA